MITPLRTLLLRVVPPILLAAAPAVAQTGPYVVLEDPAYADLELLAAHGLVEGPLLAHPPFSRFTFARAAEQAQGRLAAARSDTTTVAPVPARVSEAVARLRAAFSVEIAQLEVLEAGGEEPATRSTPLLRPRSVSVDLTTADSPPRDAREPQPGQRNDAVINPLLQRNLGRPLADGTTLGAEAVLDLQLGSRLAAQVSPRLYEPGGGGATLMAGYLRSVWGKAFFEAGRLQTLSGVTEDLSPVLSTNPRPITMFRVGNETPGRLPWIFGGLGPASFRFSVGGLGDDRFNPGAILTTLEAQFRPHPRVEFGGAILAEQGGENAPDATFLERVVDTFGFILYRRPFHLLTDRGTFSNKLLGINARWQPFDRPWSLFFEFSTEDDHNVFLDPNQGAWNNAAWVWGTEALGVGPDGRLDLRLAAIHNGAIVASHGALISGLTLEGRALGSPLGPEGSGIDLRIDWVGAETRVRFTGALERYSGDLYASPGQYLGRERVQDNPDEIRLRSTLAWSRTPSATGYFATLRAGVERVTRFDYGPESRTSVMLQAVAGYRW